MKFLKLLSARNRFQKRRKDLFTKKQYGFLTAFAAVLLLSIGFGKWVNVRSVMAGDATQITGSYRATVFAPAPAPPGTPIVRALLTFGSDGTLTGASDVVNLLQGILPGVAVSPAHGVWTRAGSNTFNSTFLSELIFSPPPLQPPPGSPCFLRVRESVTLTPIGDGYTGTTTSDILDCSGNPLAIPPLTTSLSATRITVVPQPPQP